MGLSSLLAQKLGLDTTAPPLDFLDASPPHHGPTNLFPGIWGVQV